MRAARWAAVACCSVLAVSAIESEHVRAAPDSGDALLANVGPDWTLTDETTDSVGSTTRVFEHPVASLTLMALPVTDPPGPHQVFQLATGMTGTDFEPEPSLDLAAWLTLDGEGGQGSEIAVLVFASRDFVFTFFVFTQDPTALDTRALLLELANRQLDAVGGAQLPEVDTSPDRLAAEAELAALLPSDPPPQWGLGPGVTVTGRDEFEITDDVAVNVVEFLNERAVSASRYWMLPGGDLVGAVSITEFPYGSFAAASLGAVTDGPQRELISTDAFDDMEDVALYTADGERYDQINAIFRRGDKFVIVTTAYSEAVDPAAAGQFAGELTRLAAASVPDGASEAYHFPDAPSKVVGLAFTAAIVTAAAAGSAVVARLRARRVRHGWHGGQLPPPQLVDPDRAGTAIFLDPDAQRLRRQGGIVAVGQLLTVNVFVVALAGDFAWTGVAVAIVALLAGLVLTRWWQRRELGLLGARAPSREFVLPRPAGAIVGVVSLAVLGLGVAYALKGLRYLVLNPTLAQMQWSDRFGVSPRMVGVIFAVGGFVVAVIGAWLFRLARALARAGTKRTLEADKRDAALYLRSFEDDHLPLPAIASARRPLFEMFSLRGADPFEEAVAWELNSYGPVVAVGRPGRSLASLGAAREHLPDETWREQVAARMDEAGIIVIATGETDGLAWELSQVVAGGHMPKTFFVFPPVAPDALGRRWEHTVASLARAGQAVGPLPVPAPLIHTVRLAHDGTVIVTYASRRDEATYRSAVDHAIAADGEHAVAGAPAA